MEAIYKFAAEQRPDAGGHFHGAGLLDVDDGLHADGGVFVDGDVVHGKPGAFEKVEAHFADFDAAPERAFEGGLQAAAILVGGEGGGCEPGDDEEEEQRADGLEQRTEAELHRRAPVRRL